MASSKFFASLSVLLVLLPVIVKGDNFPFPPFFNGSICSEVECGRGTCVEALGDPFNFKCQCENGWKHTRLDDESNLQFLPCVIPDCRMDYSCMPAAPPMPAVPHNFSFFDPCYWNYCGQGTCSKNLTYTHTCQCDAGYYNLLNRTYFPCYSDCALTSDCGRLGIRVSNSSSSSPSDGTNQATSFLPGKFHLVSVLLVPVAMALWK